MRDYYISIQLLHPDPSGKDYILVIFLCSSSRSDNTIPLSKSDVCSTLGRLESVKVKVAAYYDQKI